MRVLDANLFLVGEGEVDSSHASMHYLASFYWAVMMSTGLNVAIGPGLRGGQIVYECVITFFGVCLQVRSPCELPPSVTALGDRPQWPPPSPAARPL